MQFWDIIQFGDKDQLCLFWQHQYGLYVAKLIPNESRHEIAFEHYA